MTRFFRRYVSLLCDIPRAVEYDSVPRVDILQQVSQAYIQYFRASGSRFECMEAIEVALDVPRVRVGRILFWFRRVEGFPGVGTRTLARRYCTRTTVA